MHRTGQQLSQSIPPEPRRQPSSWRLSSSSSRAAAGRWPGHNTKHEKHATDTRTQGEAAVVREERGDRVTPQHEQLGDLSAVSPAGQAPPRPGSCGGKQH